MKSFLTISVAAATMTLGLMAQKLETQKPDPTKVLRVETAKDHLTVIELSDAVTMVAVGNRSAFTVERRENKVFVTPTDEGARTNLFIWTSGGRYAYELVPAADIEKMHFAIDQVATAGSRCRRRSNALRHRSSRHGGELFDPRAAHGRDRAAIAS